VHRLPGGEDFWGETLRKWREEGHLAPGEAPVEHFDLDMDRAGLIRWAVQLDAWRTIEEDDDTIVCEDGNGAVLRQTKGRAGGLEHIAFRVKERADWEEFARGPLSVLNRDRIPLADYAGRREACRAAGRHFSGDAFGPFELMQRLVGHETLLYAMAADPEWVRDMVDTYTEWNIGHWEVLFAEGGIPQAMWIAEDLGYKGKPFMSPRMFDELLLPAFARMIEWLHERCVPVILHSCGYVEPLLPGLIEAGLDCLQALEVKAGMDLPHLFDRFGDALVWFGNVDIRVVEANDRDAVDAELRSKILPVLRGGGRCLLHSDHSISPKVEYDTFRYFLDRGRELASGAGS
jgi:uroporphyrinogen decarboxylase